MPRVGFHARLGRATCGAKPPTRQVSATAELGADPHYPRLRFSLHQPRHGTARQHDDELSLNSLTQLPKESETQSTHNLFGPPKLR